jgi:serine protease
MKTHRLEYLLILMITCLVLAYPIRVLARAWLKPSPEMNAAAQQPVLNQDVPTDQVILKYKSPAVMNYLSGPAQVSQVQRLSDTAGVSLAFVRQMSGEAQVLRLADRLPVEQVRSIAERLMTLPEVEYAEPDRILQHTLTPNDPQYTNQWHYFAPSAGNYGINAPAAWDITTGSASIVAAVIDTGITNHADLSGRTVAGYDFIGNLFVANDGDGRDSDPSDPGDWVAANDCYVGSPAENSSWHGTHTAGTVGAASNNSLGVAGINWNSKILPVRVLGKCGGYNSDIVDGMRWSAGLAVTGVPNNANPAKVINLSLGGSGLCDVTTQNAVNAITAAGTTVVVSAGNSNANASGFTPANCDGVITVAATDRNGSRAYYSNYGSTVEISAPGGAQLFANDPNGVLSTLNTGTQGPVADTYIYYQGTSMAAPHVTGVVSLLYSLNPALTPAQVLQILQGTVTLFPGGSTCNTSICGSGIVNAGSAVAYAAGTPAPITTQTLTPTPTATATATPTPTGTATATATATPTGVSHTIYVPIIIHIH